MLRPCEQHHESDWECETGMKFKAKFLRKAADTSLDVARMGGWISRKGKPFSFIRRGDDHGAKALSSGLAKLTVAERSSGERDSYAEIKALENGHIRVSLSLFLRETKVYFQVYNLVESKATLRSVLRKLHLEEECAIGWGSNDEHMKDFETFEEAADWLDIL